MIILAVFILSFGIAAHSLIYGVQEFSWHLIRRVINVAYWAMFGEVEILPKFERKLDLHLVKMNLSRNHLMIV